MSENFKNLTKKNEWLESPELLNIKEKNLVQMAIEFNIS